MSLNNPNPFRAQGLDDYLVDMQFTTNGAGVPNGVAPDYGADLAVARTGVGTYTVTFAATKKPFRMRIIPQVFGLLPNSKLVASYDASTGVVTVKLYALSAGAYSVADTTGQVIQLFMFCSRSSQSK